MKVAVKISGLREDQDVEVALTQEGEAVTFDVPNLGRKQGATISFDRNELQSGLAAVAAHAGATSPAAAGAAADPDDE